MNAISVGLVEIGTNSVKYLVSYVNSSGQIINLIDRNEVTRLGQGIQGSGRLSDDGMERTLASIEKFLSEVEGLFLKSVQVFGTMALREGSNSEIFSSELRRRTGLSLNVLSGDDEATYSLRAVKSTLPMDCSGWLFDTGGGSTEFSFFRGDSMEAPFSVNLGALTLTDRFFKEDPVSQVSLEKSLEWIASQLEENRVGTRGDGDRLIGTGGNLVTMASVALGGVQLSQGSSYRLTTDEICRQVTLFARTRVEDRHLIPGVPESRSRIILGGACIALSVARSTSSLDLEVSTYGLRHGLMKKILSPFDNFV